MPEVNLRSLSDFKRVLALPGATIQCVAHSYVEHRKPRSDPFWKPRTIRAVRSADVQINMEGTTRPSHLDFGKAADWVFAGNTATLNDYGMTIKYVVALPE